MSNYLISKDVRIRNIEQHQDVPQDLVGDDDQMDEDDEDFEQGDDESGEEEEEDDVEDASQ